MQVQYCEHQTFVVNKLLPLIIKKTTMFLLVSEYQLGLS